MVQVKSLALVDTVVVYQDTHREQKKYDTVKAWYDLQIVALGQMH